MSSVTERQGIWWWTTHPLPLPMRSKQCSFGPARRPFHPGLSEKPSRVSSGTTWLAQWKRSTGRFSWLKGSRRPPVRSIWKPRAGKVTAFRRHQNQAKDLWPVDRQVEADRRRDFNTMTWGVIDDTGCPRPMQEKAVGFPMAPARRSWGTGLTPNAVSSMDKRKLVMRGKTP